MSSEVAAIREFNARQGRRATKKDCDDFYDWAEVEHRKDTMSLDEASSLLGVGIETALEMINEGTLCASVDTSTGAWLVKTGCVRAQLADSLQLSGESVATIEQAKPYAVATTVATMNFIPEPSDNYDFTDYVKEAHESGILPLNDFGFSALTSDEEEDDANITAPETKSFDRAGITAKNIEALMDSLDFANVRLEGSMYRIGYLEAQVNSMEEQLALMSEYRNRAAKAIMTDRENDILKQKIVSLETNLATHESNQAILEENLVQANVLLARIEQTWWFRLCSWMFRFDLTETN